jgi:hypothetical protein
MRASSVSITTTPILFGHLRLRGTDRSRLLAIHSHSAIAANTLRKNPNRMAAS